MLGVRKRRKEGKTKNSDIGTITSYPLRNLGIVDRFHA